jgi:membrane protein implicated in regulation of membrane protease activity
MTDVSRPSSRTVLRYALFQIPGLAVLGVLLLVANRLNILPPWAAWCIFALWILKDLLLFPLLWRSYSTSPAGLKNTLAGQEGHVRDRLDPRGRILVHGVLWQAEVVEGRAPAEAGSVVVVREMRGLTLVVEPAGEANPASPG